MRNLEEFSLHNDPDFNLRHALSLVKIATGVFQQNRPETAPEPIKNGKTMGINERLIEAYAEALSPAVLRQFEGKDDDLAGIFLPSAPEERMPLMIVGMETRKWNGHFSAVRNGEIRNYIESSMSLHRKYLTLPTKRSSFGRFHLHAASTLGYERGQIGWGNLLAVSYRKTSPVRSAAFAPILELSGVLLRKQLEIIKPEAVIFVCGWRYDSYLKQSLGGLITDSNVMTPKSLWKFKVGESTCFRTSHPRYVAGREYRDRALRLIQESAQHVG
jgi:hypothetical protein